MDGAGEADTPRGVEFTNVETWRAVERRGREGPGVLGISGTSDARGLSGGGTEGGGASCS